MCLDHGERGGMWCGMNSELSRGLPACAGLVGRNLGFILAAGCDSGWLVCLGISGCCCVRHRLRGHMGGSRDTGHGLVLSKHLWSAYCIRGAALSWQPGPCPRGAPVPQGKQT